MKAAGSIWLLVALLWIPFEDTTIWPALALAAAGSTWLAFRLKDNLHPAQLRILAAGLVPPVTIALMAFKSGVHAHGFADLTPSQVWALLQLWPLFVITPIGYNLTERKFPTGTASTEPKVH